MSASRTASRRGQAAAESAPGAGTVVLRRLGRVLAEAGEGPLAQRVAALRHGVARWLRRVGRPFEDAMRPRLLRQGLAAYARGNPEAAFALLREVSHERPGHPRVALGFWEVALACGRAPEAAFAMQALVHREVARGERERAANHWLALLDALPDAGIDPGDAVRLLPVLQTRLRAAREPEAREALLAQVRRGLRDALDPRRGELTPGLALRLLEAARSLDVGLARSAAERVLASPDLHATKRARVETLLASLDAEAASPGPESLEVLDVAPLELEAQALLLLEIAREQRTRVDYRAVEAVAVARVGGIAETPVVLVDLVMRPLRRRDRRRVLRMRADAFDARALLPDVERVADGSAAGSADEALRAFLAELLERTRAVPLPDPDSALGLHPRDFARTADWERELLARLAA